MCNTRIAKAIRFAYVNWLTGLIIQMFFLYLFSTVKTNVKQTVVPYQIEEIIKKWNPTKVFETVDQHGKLLFIFIKTFPLFRISTKTYNLLCCIAFFMQCALKWSVSYLLTNFMITSTYLIEIMLITRLII